MGLRVESTSLNEILDELEKDLENIRRSLDSCSNLEVEFVIHEPSKSVEDSVRNSGIEASKIVKTLVFVGEEPLAVLCPGDSLVSEKKLENLLDNSVKMADPSTVEEETGYIVGGVSPFDLDIPIYADKRILEVEKIKPAAGSSCIGAILNPEDLVEMVDAEVVDVAED